MSALFADLKFALRTMRRSPGVTAAAVIALALGIGANTAIFSVVDGVLLRPLPYPDSGALVSVHQGSTRQNRFTGPLSYPEYQDLVAQTRTLESAGGWVDGDINLSGAGSPERLLLRVATPSLLPTLRVQPVRGRNFLPEETVKGRDHVVLIDYGLWQRQFAGAGDVVGRTIRLDGADYQIVGVLPRDFVLDRAVEVWIPLSTADETIKVRNAHFLRVVGRRRAGATPANVATDLDAVAKYEVDTFPDMFPTSYGFGLRARPYIDEVVGDVRLALLVLLGAVAFVLLIACANVANLLLARAASRQREMAIRTALGARRGRIVRQLLTESLLLSLIGGALGIGFASWGIDLLLAMTSLPRVGEVGLHLDVLLFSSAIAVATGVGFGLVPAISASRPDLQGSLKDGTRGTTVGRGRLRKALVVSEVALSLVLLVGAGLMVRSFLKLRDVDPGFRPDHALMLRVSLPVPDSNVSDADRTRFAGFYDRAVNRLRQLPGVTAAGGCTLIPLDGGMTDRLFDIEGYAPGPADEHPDAQNRQIIGDYFPAIGIPLKSGRLPGAGDDAHAPPVVVVNDTFAKKFFPRGDVLGKRIRLGALGPLEFPWGTIVGVVGDVRAYGLDEKPMPEMYWSALQGRTHPAIALVMRTSGEPTALGATARAALAEVDPVQPIFDVQAVDSVVATSLGQRRFTLTLMLVFGVVALLLAAVGIYGVMAYTVSQRTQELGIRVALGATPSGVMRMVLRDGMTLVALGLGIGLGAAMALSRLVTSLLYGISAVDVTTYAVIAGALTTVALVAIIVPARRAMRVDPMQALRSE
jgi:putative ABC transport system permease protein